MASLCLNAFLQTAKFDIRKAEPMDSLDIALVLRSAEDALHILDVALSNPIPERLWINYFKTPKHSETVLWLLGSVRTWLHGWLNDCPEILDSQPMYFVGSLTPDPHAAASIVPDKRTIWLYDSFFEGCRTPEDIELRTWMRFCCEYRRALLIIHELIHFKSHQWWSALCLRIDDPRFNTLGKKRGLTLVHDMGIAISKVPGACTWENFDAEIEPNTLGFSRREKKDLENTPPQTTEQVRIDGYESRGARILARSIEGDIGALLNADSYTELAGRAFMAHHMSLYRRRLSVPLLKNGVKEQEKTRRQSMFEWLRQ